MFQHKEQPSIIKLSQTRKANSRLSPIPRKQSRLLPPSPKSQPKPSLIWEVQPKPPSSPEVQCSTFKQPTKACLIDSVPATCQKEEYKAITTSFKQGRLYLPNQPMITVTPSPDQRPGNLMISLRRPLPTAIQQHLTSCRQGCSRPPPSLHQMMHQSPSFSRMTHVLQLFSRMTSLLQLLSRATCPRLLLFSRMTGLTRSFTQTTLPSSSLHRGMHLPLLLGQATCSRPPSSVEQGTSSHCSVE